MRHSSETVMTDVIITICFSLKKSVTVCNVEKGVDRIVEAVHDFFVGVGKKS